MNIKSRIEKAEKQQFNKQIKQLFDNIKFLPDGELNTLCDLLVKEREKRGILEPSEIVAARGLFEQLSNDGVKPSEAIERVVKAAKTHGVSLTANDFLPRLKYGI